VTVSGSTQLRGAHRIRELARRIYELQSFPWFDDLILNLKKSSLSGGVFEADVAARMMSMPGSTALRPAVVGLSQNYDIGYELGELKLAVEVKTKDEDKPFNVKSVLNTIKQASEQLPGGDIPGVLFIRIPGAWVGPGFDDAYNDVLMRATGHGHSATSRIAVIFTAIDKVHLSGRKGGVTRVFDHFKSVHCTDEVWRWARFLKALLDADLHQLGPRAHF